MTDEWISVKEGLPQYEEPIGIPRGNSFPFVIVEYNNPNQYLCYTSLNVFELCDFEKDGTWTGDLRGDEFVTHYKSIQPPQTL